MISNVVHRLRSYFVSAESFIEANMPRDAAVSSPAPPNKMWEILVSEQPLEAKMSVLNNLDLKPYEGHIYFVKQRERPLLVIEVREGTLGVELQ